MVQISTSLILAAIVCNIIPAIARPVDSRVFARMIAFFVQLSCRKLGI
jgi:hypothetical protein